MAVLRTWSGQQALAGLLTCFIALQGLVAGLHAAYVVELQLFANDLALNTVASFQAHYS
jgi:hypothetical protein